MRLRGQRGAGMDLGSHAEQNLPRIGFLRHPAPRRAVGQVVVDGREEVTAERSDRGAVERDAVLDPQDAADEDLVPRETFLDANRTRRCGAAVLPLRYSL